MKQWYLPWLRNSHISKLSVHNMGISSALWPAAVCGSKKQWQRSPVVGGSLGRGLAVFIPPSHGRCLWGHSSLITEIFTTNTHQKNKVVSHPLSICFFRPGERPKRQIWDSLPYPNLTSSYHYWLAQGNKHTHSHSTMQDGWALLPLQSALIFSSVCAAEDNLEALACSRTHCLSHTAIKCTSLSGCPVSLGQERLSPS